MTGTIMYLLIFREYMRIERPQDVHPKSCPDCGEEMLFSGTQPAGYAQFFCEHCRYRRDMFVGEPAANQSPSADDPTPTEAVDSPRES
jgi:hypothetical protein